MKRKLQNTTSKVKSSTNRIWSISAIAVILVLWQLISSLGIVDSFMLPSPIQVVQALVSEFPVLAEHSVITLSEAFLGLILGILLGFVMAVLMDRFDVLYQAFYPLIVLNIVTIVNTLYDNSHYKTLMKLFLNTSLSR